MLFELLIWRQGLVVQKKFAADHVIEKYEDAQSIQGNSNNAYEKDADEISI